MVACKHMGGLQTYGASNIQGAIQTYGRHPNIWGTYEHSLSLTKHAFFLLYMYSRHPYIQQTSKHMWGCSNRWHHPNIQGASKLMGISKHTGGIPTNVGVSKHMGASKHMQSILTYGDVQTYRGHSYMHSYPMKWVLPLVLIKLTRRKIHNPLISLQFYTFYSSYIYSVLSQFNPPKDCRK